jgi:hypothetical protein
VRTTAKSRSRGDVPTVIPFDVCFPRLGFEFGTLGEQSSDGREAGHSRIIADELGGCSKSSGIKHVSEGEKLRIVSKKQVVEQLIKPAEKQQIMTHESKFTCATCEKCGMRPRARNDQKSTGIKNRIAPRKGASQFGRFRCCV